MLCGCLLAEFQAGVLSSHKLVVTEQFTQVKGDSGREGEGFAAREVFFCKSLNETSPHEWAGLDFVTLMYPPVSPSTSLSDSSLDHFIPTQHFSR